MGVGGGGEEERPNSLILKLKIGGMKHREHRLNDRGWYRKGKGAEECVMRGKDGEEEGGEGI